MKDRSDIHFENLPPHERQRLLQLMRKAPTRRDFMGLMMAAGASATAAGGLFSSAGKALAETPKRGGRLLLAGATHSPNDTLDPALNVATTDYWRSRAVYGSLVRLQNDLSYEPELAEEIIPNADATQWTFKLKKGVEFHDGKTMTADDVIYSMNRHLGEDSTSGARSLVKMITEWKKVNDYEVVANLSSPNADLPILLGTFHFKILQEGTTDFSMPQGTGPYKVKEFKPGIRFVGTRFENYPFEGAYLDEVEHTAINDPVARLNAFLAGDVDAIAQVSPRSLPTIEAADGKEVWAMESAAYLSIAARLDMEVSNNRDMLTAMQYLMDRERLVKGTLKGQGSFGNDQPIGPAYFDHCPDIPQRRLDPERAKYHFDKSGIGQSEIPITVAEVAPGAVEQATFLQREAQKIGMNVVIKKVATDGYWSSVWLKHPFCIVRWNMRPTANSMLSLAYKSTSKWNDSYWKNEQFDQIVDDVLSVTDPDKRKQMYCDAQTLIHETGGTILPVHLNYVDAAASYVKGRTYVPLNNFGGAESAPFLWRDDA